MKLRATALGLLGLSIGLGWVCLRLIEAPVTLGEIPPGAAWAPDGNEALTAEDLGSSRQDTDPVILARLVFSPTRRPPKPRPPEPQAAEPQTQEQSQQSQAVIDVALPDSVILRGVYIAEGRREALILTPSHPEGAWFKPGGGVEGWTVSRIEPDRIALANGSREVALTLYVDNSGK